MTTEDLTDVWSAEWAQLNRGRLAGETLRMEAVEGFRRESIAVSEHAISTGGLSAAIVGKIRSSIQPTEAERHGDEVEHTVGFRSQQNAESSAGQVEAGEILLLHPSLDPGWERSVYVLVTGGDEAEDWVEIVPFSPISSPAAETEFCTELPEPELSVLQGWNSARVESEKISNHWKIDRVDEGLLESVVDFLGWVKGRTDDVPEKFLGRVGPLLNLGDEMRFDYYDEEERLLEKLKSGEKQN